MAILAFQKPDKVVMLESTDTHGKFEFRPLEPGYGLTVGNALRRVLLSSLEGFAINNIKIEGVTVLTNFQNNQQISYNDLLRLKFSNPVLPLTTDKIILEEAKDSVFHKITPKIIIDSLSSCIYFVSYPWKEEMNYRFRINKDSAKDVYGYSCDSLIKSFKSSATDYYSAVNFSFTGTDNSYVFQIIDAKETVVTEWSGKLPQTKKLDRLNPGKYKLRAFADNNNNGKWDTGCYLEHKQPEKLYFYSEEINLRSNWEIEVKWELKEPL